MKDSGIFRAVEAIDLESISLGEILFMGVTNLEAEMFAASSCFCPVLGGNS
jgi:hypothetical protein